MKNFVQPGDTLSLTAPSGGVVSGLAYLIGSIFCVATATAAEGAQFQGKTSGVFTLPKTTGQTWAEGDPLYWDNSTKKLTTVAADNLNVAAAVSAALTGATTGVAKINEAGAKLTGLSAPGSAIAALAGTLTGTVDGTIADVAALSTAGGNTYSDAAVNVTITSVNLQLKELQTKLNAALAALRAANIIAE